jgi:hypothetical protein
VNPTRPNRIGAYQSIVSVGLPNESPHYFDGTEYRIENDVVTRVALPRYLLQELMEWRESMQTGAGDH